MENKKTSMSWFVVLNNPEEHGYSGTYKEILKKLCDEWCTRDGRAWAGTYCLSAAGLHHVHMVCSDDTNNRFSAVKKIYPAAHIEITLGSKREAEDYIYKKGAFEDSTEKILEFYQVGEIKGHQGKRTDYDKAQDMLEKGFTPDEFVSMHIRHRRLKKDYTSAYLSMKKDNLIKTNGKPMRTNHVTWHCGASGTGKSYEYILLGEKYGFENIYRANDYSNSGTCLFDKYQGEDIIFLDEFKGQLPFSYLLQILDDYICDIHCRYDNVCSLWSQVHVSTVFPPDMIYKKMVSENMEVDNIKQLYRRINDVVYHYVDAGEYKKDTVSSSDYAIMGYELLKLHHKQGADGFMNLDSEEDSLFW